MHGGVSESHVCMSQRNFLPPNVCSKQDSKRSCTKGTHVDSKLSTLLVLRGSDCANGPGEHCEGIGLGT